MTTNTDSLDNLELTDKIARIKRDLPILELVNHYVTLNPRGKVFHGTCPLCFSNDGLYVMPYKNTFRCYGCGHSGDPISFIMKYENIQFKEAVEFIVTKFFNTLGYPENLTTDIMRGDVYVLGLVDKHFYIGFTRNFEKRMTDHFNGNGSMWTKKFKPEAILERFQKKTLNYENYLTEKYINEHGYDQVRGGDHIFFNKKYSINRHQ
jgi:predicted GIY-YIG superfamily endonuclease